MIFQEESGDIDTEASYLCDAELNDEIIGKALSSPMFIEEREEPAKLRQTYHSHEESLLPVLFSHTSTGRPVYELSSCQKRKSSRDMENERIRILLERQKEQILAEVRTEIQIWDPEARTSSRVWQKKYPGITWNYWFSANGNWSYCYRVWPIQARSITTSIRTIRTKSGSSWNSYPKSSWDGRIEESSKITNRWIFEKKIDRKSGHY